MALETGNYIDNLVATNPPGTDPKSQGDDHLRLIKNALKNCFAGFTGSIMITGTDGGAANAYTITSTPALLAYSTRMIAVFSPTADNTGAATLNISGIGVRNLKSVAGADLQAGELTIGTVYAAFYNGTEFRLLSITKGYADQLAFSAALPAQAGNAGRILGTNGTVAAWVNTINIPFTFGAAATLAFGNRVDEAKGADIASAATINLSTATGNLIHITGNTGPITAITIPVGAERTLIFDSNPILTHSASLLLPTAANIQVAAGDRVKVRGDTAGANVVSYTRADGTALAATRYALGLPIVLTPTVAANLDALTSFTAQANNYLIEVEGIRPNAGTDQLKYRFANGGVADAGSNYFDLASTGGAAGGAVTQANFSGNVVSGNKGVSGRIEVQNANATTTLKSANSYAFGETGAGSYSGAASITGYISTSAISGIRFFWSGGASFAAVGTIRIYPIVNA